MTSFLNPGRVFLVGCPRSGTTLLQSMLMASTGIESFPESHLFDTSFGTGKRALLCRVFRGAYLWFHLGGWIKTLRAHGFSPPPLRPSWSRRRMIRRAVASLDAMTLSAGKHVWVEKTPGHLHHIDRIQSLVAHPRFIHIVRDGRATVASLHVAALEQPQAWRWARSVEACVQRWNRCIAISARYADEPGHHVVRYRDLVDDPEAVLAELCDFLDVAFEESMVSDYAASAERVIRPGEDWKAANAGPLRDPGLEKFSRTFDAATQRQVEAALDLDVLRSLPRRATRDREARSGGR